VVVWHAYVTTLNEPLADLFGPGVEFALVHLRPGVESFFILAGFFIAHMLRPPPSEFLSVRRFLLRRVVRLMIPYWGAIALPYLDRVAVNAVLGHDNYLPTPGEFLVMAFAVNDLFGVTNLNPFLWSMATLLQYYVLWAAAFWVVRRGFLAVGAADYAIRTRRVMQLLAAAVLVASVAAKAAGVWDQWQLPGVAFYFGFGSLVYWASHGQLRWWYVAAAAVPVAGLGYYAGDSQCFKALGCGAVLTWLASGHALPGWPPVRAFEAVGRWSFSIYLIHGWVLYRVINLSNHWRGTDALTDRVVIAFFLAGIGASVAAGYVYFRLVEQPVAQFSRRMTYRQ
jgi:peptidoglycan/LPS O-acetylase OafA/YrhL